MAKLSDMRSQVAVANISEARIGVVTVTYNSSLVLPEFLNSLDKQGYQNFVLVAVDNASTDDTIDQLSAWNSPKLILITNTENRGVAAANNQGIRAALATGCDHVLLINNDVVFGKDIVQQLLDGLQTHNCQMTTPIIYYNDEPDVIWCAGGVFEPWYGYRSMHTGDGQKDDGQFTRSKAVAYVPTCCLMIRREVFDRIGFMDERYFVYSDDTDFMYRAWLARLPIFFLPDAKLWHKVSSLTGGNQSDFTLYYGSRGRALFLAKHFGAILGVAWALAYSIGYPLRSLFGQDSWHQACVRVKGVLDGFRVGIRAMDVKDLQS